MQAFRENLPLILTILGVALATVLPGIGSSIGAKMVGKAAAALISEQPEKFGQSLVLQMMSASQGLYGFIIGFLILMNLTGVVLEDSIKYLGAGLIMAMAGFFTAIQQSIIATAGMQILAKKPEHSTKGVIYSAMVETFAIFAFVISVLIVL